MSAEAHNQRVVEIRSQPHWWRDRDSRWTKELADLAGGGCNEHGVYIDPKAEELATVGMAISSAALLVQVPAGYWIGAHTLKTSWGYSGGLPSVWDRAFDTRDECRTFLIEGLIHRASEWQCASDSVTKDVRKLATKLRLLITPTTREKPMTTPGTVMTASLSLHPEAGLVPEMPADQYAAFLADVKERGVLQPIELIPGTFTVIDGRTRLRAANDAKLGTVPVIDADLRGDTPVVYMLRVALLRRHSTNSQRAAMAVEIEAQLSKAAKERQKEGGKSAGKGRPKQVVAELPQPKPTPAPKSRDVAAAIAGTKPRAVSDAKLVKKNSPETFEKLKAGTVTLAKAVEAVKGPKPAKSALAHVKPSSFAIASPPKPTSALVSITGGQSSRPSGAPPIDPNETPLVMLTRELEETAVWLDERADVLAKTIAPMAAKHLTPLSIEVARLRGRAGVIRHAIEKAKDAGLDQRAKT